MKSGIQGMSMNKFNKLAFAASTLALVGASSSAMAVGTGMFFTIDETVVDPTGNPNVVANSIDFSYNARIDQSISGPTLSHDPFQEIGWINLSSYDDGAPPKPSQHLNSTYGLYGIFSLTGTATYNGTGIDVTFNPGGSLTLYVDPNFDTTLVAPVDDGTADGVLTTNVTTGNTADDIEIGSALAVGPAQAHIFGGLANGDYDLIFQDWNLTAFGSTFFTSPDPFFMSLEFTGVTTTVGANASPFVAFSTLLGGSGNAFFVPEPGIAALMGLGLLGLGATRRRRG
jgi:hypothetical protein